LGISKAAWSDTSSTKTSSIAFPTYWTEES
jgi:hypothetical protein